MTPFLGKEEVVGADVSHLVPVNDVIDRAETLAMSLLRALEDTPDHGYKLVEGTDERIKAGECRALLRACQTARKLVR